MDISKLNDIDNLRLEPNNLKDTTVSFAISSDYSVSKLYEVIEEKFTGFQRINLVNRSNPNIATGQFFLSDGKFKIFISDSLLEFNIVKEYPGWKAYESFIDSIMNELGTMIKLNCASLVYASFHPDCNVFSEIDGCLKLNRLPIIFDGTTLQFSCSPDVRAAGDLTVLATILLRHGVELDGVKCSLTSISVGIEGNPLLFPTSIYKAWINLLHSVQKNLFFNIMSEDFVTKRIHR